MWAMLLRLQFARNIYWLIKTIQKLFNRLRLAGVTVSAIDAHVFYGSQCIMSQAAAADNDVTVQLATTDALRHRI